MKLQAHSVKAGFTLIETVLVLVILGILLVPLFLYERDVFSLNRGLQGAFVAQAEARATLKRLTAELRSVSPSSMGAYPLETTTGASLTFFSDVDDDGRKERLRYVLAGGEFQRGIVVPTGTPLTYDLATEVLQTVAHDVAAGTPVFAYYDTAYDGTTAPLPEPVDPTVVRLVRVSLTLDPAGSRAPAPVVLTTQVSLRNLKDNL